MDRVDACAVIYAADKPERIGKIAENKGVDAHTAAVIYTLGALKYLKKRGIARNYADAIAQIEDRQVGARVNPLQVTASADNTAGQVARLNRLTNASDMAVYREGFTVSPEGVAEQARFFVEKAKSEDPKSEPRRHTVNMGKVFGTLYTQWEEREADDTLENDFTAATVKRNLTAFFKEYEDRLSDRSRQNLYAITKYTGDAKDITSAEARNDPETKRLYKTVDNLFYNFPHKDAITRPQFVDMVREYIMPPSIA
jgi:hypothetical protein